MQTRLNGSVLNAGFKVSKKIVQRTLPQRPLYMGPKHPEIRIRRIYKSFCVYVEQQISLQLQRGKKKKERKKYIYLINIWKRERENRKGKYEDKCGHSSPPTNKVTEEETHQANIQYKT